MRGVTPDDQRDVRDTMQFLLTRLMRGVTACFGKLKPLIIISTHTPHARRDHWMSNLDGNVWISTHTPHARRDPMGLMSDV